MEGKEEDRYPYAKYTFGGPRDKGTWKIIDSNKFVIYWEDIPKWNCTVRLNSKGKVIRFVDDSGSLLKDMTKDY